MNIHQIISNKKYPSKLRNNPITNKKTIIPKIFPLIGLKNSSEKISNDYYDWRDNYNKTQLARQIYDYILNIDMFLGRWALSKDTTDYETLSLTSRALRSLRLDLWTTNLPKISEEKYFKELNKLIEGLQLYNKKYKIVNRINTFKVISKTPKTQLKITFSSNKKEGIWDIATMSMRGISSCMSWSSSHSSSLLGSILDPCCGIIYIATNDKTTHGSKMIARAVVRYVVDERSKKPYLILEPIYTPSERNATDDHWARLVFIKYLNSKSKIKVNKSANNCYHCTIPTINLIDKKLINDHPIDNTGYLTYSDNEYEYSDEIYSSTRDIYNRTFLRKKKK